MPFNEFEDLVDVDAPYRWLVAEARIDARPFVRPALTMGMRTTHAPEGYVCNFCRIAGGLNGVLTTQDDVVLHNEDITAFVASHWWPANPGHVLVIPNQHIENIYEFPARLGGPLMQATRTVATAMKTLYRCSGVSTRQHNEPDGNQDVWHFHQHVFPRYPGDDLYVRHYEKSLADEVEKAIRARGLREVIEATS